MNQGPVERFCREAFAWMKAPAEAILRLAEIALLIAAYFAAATLLDSWALRIVAGLVTFSLIALIFNHLLPLIGLLVKRRTSRIAISLTMTFYLTATLAVALCAVIAGGTMARQIEAQQTPCPQTKGR